ncbi:MAG: hypothetical protein ABSB32_06070 [Thermodesulfobacteriota bacterium]
MTAEGFWRKTNALNIQGHWITRGQNDPRMNGQSKAGPTPRKETLGEGTDATNKFLILGELHPIPAENDRHDPTHDFLLGNSL